MFPASLHFKHRNVTLWSHFNVQRDLRRIFSQEGGRRFSQGQQSPDVKDQVRPGRHVPRAAQAPDSAQEASRPQEEPSSQVAARCEGTQPRGQARAEACA